MRTLNPLLVALLNRTDLPGSRIIAHIVPTRILRVIDVHDDGMIFRVEQLVFHSHPRNPAPTGAWMTKTTHSGQRSGESLKVAFEHAHAAQQKLIKTLQKRAGAVTQRIIRP